MFSQPKVGYAGPSPPPVRLALRPVTPALSQRVRSLGDCSDRIALEKSEKVDTILEVVSPLLTKTTIVRRKIRSEYTARYEDFCRGGDKVKPSSSDFWESQQSNNILSSHGKPGKRAETSSSVASSVFRQLPVTEPKEVRAPVPHHAQEEKVSGAADSAADTGSQLDQHGHPPRSPPQRRRSIAGGSLFAPGGRRIPSAAEEGRQYGRDSAATAAESSKAKEENPYVTSFRRFIMKYDNMTEKLDSYIADSLACKTSLAALSLNEEERQRISLLDNAAASSSHRLNKYLTRKFDAESSRKQLEDKAAAASRQPPRLRRLNSRSLMHTDEVDAVYKTPRHAVHPAMLEEAKPKAEVVLSRPQTSMKKKIEEMGAHLDTLAFSAEGSVGGNEESASSNVTLAMGRLLLKSSQGDRPWSQKDLPLIEGARSCIGCMRVDDAMETSPSPVDAQPSQPSPQPSAAALHSRAQSAASHVAGTRAAPSQPMLHDAESPSTPTVTRRLLRTSKQNLTRLEDSPQAKPDTGKAATEAVVSKKTALNAQIIDAMAQEVLATFYARLVGIYRSDCIHFKCVEVGSFLDSLQKRHVIIAPSGQNDLSLVCAPLANVIPYIPQMRVLQVTDYYINAAAAEKLLRAVVRSPQLRVLQFEFCRVSLDCCAAVGLALSREDAGETDAKSASPMSGKATAEQKKTSVIFKVPEDASGADAALQGAAADLTGDAARILSQEMQTVTAAGKGKTAVPDAARAEESEGVTDGEADDRKPAAARLARAKRVHRLSISERGMPNLVVLKMSRCNLTGMCVAALCEGLSNNRGVKKLDLSFNTLGKHAAGAESLGRLLASSSSLTDLNIGHNIISESGSLSIARGLLANSTLQHLDVQSNMFGSQAAQAALTESLRSPSNAITHLIFRNCALDAISAVMLSDGMVAAPRLQFVDVSHNMLGAQGCHAFLHAHGIMSSRRPSDWNQNSLVIAPLLTSSQALHQQSRDSAAKVLCNDFVFDVSDFPGRYACSLAAAGGYHNSVLRWMLHFEATGRAAISSMVGGKPSSKSVGGEEMDEELRQLRASTKLFGAWTMPLDCVANRSVVITCQSLFNRVPTASDTISPAYLRCFDVIIAASSSVDVLTAVPFVPSLLPLHQWVSVSDALSVLKVITRERERVEFCAFAVIALFDPDGREKIFAALSQHEQQLLKNKLSKSAMEWTPYNATGHWQLDLEDAVDRRLSHTLCSLLRSALDRPNQNCIETLGFDAAGLPFFPKVLEPGDLWRNAKIKHKSEAAQSAPVGRSRPATASEVAATAQAQQERFPSFRHHALPALGLLEVDFVCVHRLPPACSPVDGASWQCIVDEVTEALRTGDFAAMQRELLKLRHRSNSLCIQSDMLHQLLNLFKLPTSRSDIVVMFYRRVTDWIGLQRRLQNWLSHEVFASAVEARIGLPVAFDDFSLVGYYDLQLAAADHRSFLKRALALANDHVGLSIHDWVYDGIQDDYPAEWADAHVEIPRNSYVTFRVCCSAHLLDSISEAARGAVPKDWAALQPAGTSWLAQHKIDLLRERLLGGKRNAGKGIYRTMKQLFDAFDIDHSGDISLDELKIGLSKLSIFMYPYELKEVMLLIDKDGSGFLELDEMEAVFGI